MNRCHGHTCTKHDMVDTSIGDHTSLHQSPGFDDHSPYTLDNPESRYGHIYIWSSVVQKVGNFRLSKQMVNLRDVGILSPHPLCNYVKNKQNSLIIKKNVKDNVSLYTCTYILYI